MKIAPLFLSFLFAPLMCALGAETAYHALRVVGTARGQDTLNHVISVQGRSGAPQPGRWKVTLEDATARGGVRELDIANGKIVAEHTPVGALGGNSVGPAMDFHKLNLDSEGAFTIVQKEAQKARVSFDSVDYALHAGTAAPVWAVTLRDVSGRNVGSMRIAADTGAVVRSDLFGRRPPGEPDSGGPIVRQQAPPPPPQQRRRTMIVDDGAGDTVVVDRTDRTDRVDRSDRSRSYDDYDDDGEPRGRLRVGHRINKALHQAGASLEEFFTGRRTIDRRYRDD